jgi:hypothetical protein
MPEDIWYHFSCLKHALCEFTTCTVYTQTFLDSDCIDFWLKNKNNIQIWQAKFNLYTFKAENLQTFTLDKC